MLVAHKKGDVIVRLSSDDGRYQAGGAFGFETEAVPQLRACLRGRSYRARLYSAERLLYPMVRVGERGEGRFKRVSWDEALDRIAKKMIELKDTYGPTAILDQSYAGASYGVLHKSDQIEGLLARFLGMFGCRTSSWSVPSYQAQPSPAAPRSAPSRTATRTTPSRTRSSSSCGAGTRPTPSTAATRSTTCGWPSSAAASSSWSTPSTRIRRRPMTPGGFPSAPIPTRRCWPRWRTTSLSMSCRTRPSSTVSAWAWTRARCRTGRAGTRTSRTTSSAPTTGSRRRRSGLPRSAAWRQTTSASLPTCTPAPSRRR